MKSPFSKVRLFALIGSLLIGLPVVLGVLLSFRGEGESQPQARSLDVQWPDALENLSSTVVDMAVDDGGVLWFPLLESGADYTQKNTLYRYDTANGSLQTFPLPSDPGGTFLARIEAGRGARAGKVIVGWESTLLEVDRTTGAVSRIPLPLELSKFDFGPGTPIVTRMMDVAVGGDGTVWLSRDYYPYLIAISGDGSYREFALPAGSGNPSRLAVDGEGRIWAALSHHQVTDGATAGNLTMRFHPDQEQMDVLPWQSGSIAGQGGKVVAIGGRGPATVRRLDVVGAAPQPLSEFGPAFPHDEVAVGPDGAVWYRSPVVNGLVRLAADGASNVFSLPTLTGNLADTGCRPHPTKGSCQGTFTTGTSIFGIAAAPDGSAWFSTGDSIGHAVP